MQTQTTSELRNELRSLMDRFALTSRSPTIRRELGATIEAAYVNDYITRDEYQSLMADIT